MTEFSMPWNGVSLGDATSAPYDANTEWANYMRSAFGFGANRNDSGVLFGSGAETAQLEGLQVTQNSPAAANVLVNIGNALVHGTWYNNTSAITVTVAANASGNPRIDTVILRKTWASQQVRVAILTGTPAVTPAPPNLTQSDGTTWEIPIADIAVANGFATITEANIASRAVPTNVSDGVYLDRILNNSGVTLVPGTPVIWDPTATRAVKTWTLATQSQLLAGIWQGRTAAAGYGRVLNRGIGYIRTAAAVTAGQYIYSNSGSSTVIGSNERLINTIGIFLETTSVAGYARCFIDAGLQSQYGPILATARLAAPAASITVGAWNSVWNTLVVEFHLRSAIVANNENVNFKWNNDGTAANYYSYAGAIFTAVAVVAGTQNLGATAGTLLNVPGSTAPAGYFAYGVITINNVMQAADVKHITGTYYESIANANGSLFVYNLGGRHNDGGQILSLTAVTAGANNFATGSYINIYAKQTF